MAFCGEEMGLIGSRYYTENPLIPLEKMVCLLQMDMVGRNEETATDKADDNVHSIHLVGSKRISTELHEITLDLNKHIGFEFEYDEEDVYERSDHANFARKGVPITFLFSGFHPDYHRPTDTVDKINFDKIVSAARLNYLVLQKIAGLPEMVKRDVGG
jgi:Zn-dependent M28 family amino/carboxypeptidase